MAPPPRHCQMRHQSSHRLSAGSAAPFSANSRAERGSGMSPAVRSSFDSCAMSAAGIHQSVENTHRSRYFHKSAADTSRSFLRSAFLSATGSTAIEWRVQRCSAPRSLSPSTPPSRARPSPGNPLDPGSPDRRGLRGRRQETRCLFRRTKRQESRRPGIGSRALMARSNAPGRPQRASASVAAYMKIRPPGRTHDAARPR